MSKIQMPDAARYPKPDGYVSVARAVFSADDLLAGDPYCKIAAWLWLIATATRQPRIARWKTTAVPLQRGEVLLSYGLLARKWGWGSKGQVERFMRLLEKTGRIAVRNRTDAGTVYLIVNYDAYQAGLPLNTSDNGSLCGTPTERERDSAIVKGNSNSKINRSVTQQRVTAPLTLDLTPAPVVAPASPAKPALAVAVADADWEQDAEFVALKDAYPKRKGSHGWPAAYRLYKTARRKGTPYAALQQAVAKYRDECLTPENPKRPESAKWGTPMVKQAQTFFGSNNLPEYLPAKKIAVPLDTGTASRAIISSVPVTEAADEDDDTWAEVAATRIALKLA